MAKRLPFFPKEVPPWIFCEEGKREYWKGWKARADGRPNTEGPVTFNSTWYNGWADADQEAKRKRD